MSFKENHHFHQSDKLTFLSPEYQPIKLDKEKNKLYGTISWDGVWKVSYQKQLPKIGGYIADRENIYGNPVYCPNATRNHKKHTKT